MSGFRSTRYVRFKVDGSPPPRLWESGNPAPFAGFPSAVENLFLVFHAAAFPQPFPGDPICRRTTTAILARCSGPPDAARTGCSRSHPDVRTPSPHSPLTFPASASARSEKLSLPPRPYCPGSPRAGVAPRTPPPDPFSGRAKTRCPLQRRDPKPLIELGQVLFPQKLVGPLPRDNPTQAQLLRQPPLPGSKPALRSPPRLRRIRRDHPNIQFLQRSSHLRRTLRIYFSARPGRPKVVTGAVAVQRAENPFCSITSRSARSTVSVDSSSTSCA